MQIDCQKCTNCSHVQAEPESQIWTFSHNQGQVTPKKIAQRGSISNSSEMNACPGYLQVSQRSDWNEIGYVLDNLSTQCQVHVTLSLTVRYGKVAKIFKVYCMSFLKLLFIFKIWSYRIVFDVIKNVCKLFDDRMFNNLVIINLTFYSCIYLC